MDDIEERNRKQMFVLNAMPSGWQEYADELKDAAEHLWQNKQYGIRVTLDMGLNGGTDLRQNNTVSRTYILLSGFAIENLLKGLMVAQEPSHIASGAISGELKSHNLLYLASKINGLMLSPEEKAICTIAQDAIPYWGRYPVPLKFTDVHPETAASEEYRSTFLSLHSKLGRLIHNRVRDGWDSGVGPNIFKSRSREFGDVMDPEESFFE